MEPVASDLRPMIKEETLNFKGGGRLVPIKPDVLKVDSRIQIVNVETGLFGESIMPMKSGKIVEIREEGTRKIIKARFPKKSSTQRKRL